MNEPRPEMRTSNPHTTISDDLNELIVDMSSIQPKLHKRATEKIKRRQLAYILGETAKIFSVD